MRKYHPSRLIRLLPWDFHVCIHISALQTRQFARIFVLPVSLCIEGCYLSSLKENMSRPGIGRTPPLNRALPSLSTLAKLELAVSSGYYR
jgi:hypothetical protein